jgi:hypothetical protein
MSESFPYCDAVPTKFPLTFTVTTDGVYHNHNCPAVKRELKEQVAYQIEIGNPYVARDPGAHERHMRYLKKKGLIP